MQISRHYHGFGFLVCPKPRKRSQNAAFLRCTAIYKEFNNGATTLKVTTVLLTSVGISIISGTNHYSLSSPQSLKTNVSSPSCHLHMWIMPSAPIVRSNILAILLAHLPTVVPSLDQHFLFPRLQYLPPLSCACGPSLSIKQSTAETDRDI